MNCIADFDDEPMAPSPLSPLPPLPEQNFLEKEPLAFTTDPTLVHATSRFGVPIYPPTNNNNNQEPKKKSFWSTSDHDNNNNNDIEDCVWINVEVFEENTSATTSPVVIFIPGICESAETLTVQTMAQWAKSIGMRLAVIEIQGHGLSTGTLDEMPTHLHVLVRQVLFSVKRTTSILCHERSQTPYLVSGSSFGGTLALYAAECISRKQQQQQLPNESNPVHQQQDNNNNKDEEDPFLALLQEDEALWKGFETHGTLAGVVAVAPAVGVNAETLPPSWMISSLSVLSSLFPKAQVPFCPLEDATQYNCPATTTRNFQGRWPLGLSKFLLDVTSSIVPQDVARGNLTLSNIARVVLVAGAKDVMIPVSAIQALEEQIQAPSKEVMVLPKVGHDILTNPKSSSKALEKLFGTLLP